MNKNIRLITTEDNLKELLDVLSRNWEEISNVSWQQTKKCVNEIIMENLPRE